MVEKLLEVEDLTKSYGPGAGVFGLTFDILEGETVGLLGPNGSGKSTTLHCLTGIIDEKSGSIRISGIPHREPEAKDVFGFLPDDLPLPGSLKSREIRLLYRRLRPSFDAALADFLIELLGLKGNDEKYLANYSHGMKRKLQLAIALAHRPRLLILDEPMRGLDPAAVIVLRTLLETFASQGGAVLVATHDLLAAEQYCSRVVILSGGEVIAEGCPRRLAEEAGVQTLERYFVKATGAESEIDKTRARLREMRYVREVRSPVSD